MIAQRAIELILVSIMLLILSRHVPEFPIFYSGHRAGTVRAPYGHRTGTVRALRRHDYAAHGRNVSMCFIYSPSA